MKIAIIGSGSMGKWFARCLAPHHSVLVYDIVARRMARLPESMQAKDTEAVASFHPDLLLNAVSIRSTEEVFRKLLPLLPESCLLADITSVKGKLPEFYRACQRPFVSLHPMFGGSTSHRNRENMILINESDPAGKEFFRAFSQQQGLRLWEYSFQEHDEMMAYSLTLPFAATISFAACIDGHEVPGTTFSRHLKIVRRLLAEDEQLLSEILFNPHSLQRLEKICQNMEYLKHVIRGRDEEEVRRLLSRLKKNSELHLERKAKK